MHPHCHLNAYISLSKQRQLLTGEMGELLEAIKWGTDFIMASMPNPNQYVVLYGNVTADFLYYGPPEVCRLFLSPMSISMLCESEVCIASHLSAAFQFLSSW